MLSLQLFDSGQEHVDITGTVLGFKRRFIDPVTTSTKSKLVVRLRRSPRHEGFYLLPRLDIGSIYRNAAVRLAALLRATGVLNCARVCRRRREWNEGLASGPR